MTEASLQDRVRSTMAAAKYHKRAIGTHRKALRERMEELKKLQIQCESLGIAFHIESEGKPHGSKSPADN